MTISKDQYDQLLAILARMDSRVERLDGKVEILMNDKLVRDTLAANADAERQTARRRFYAGMGLVAAFAGAAGAALGPTISQIVTGKS